MTPPVAKFDSATAMLSALAEFLHGRDFRALGQPAFLETVVPVANHLPGSIREGVYAVGGVMEAASHGRIARYDANKIYSWLARQYPRERHPCVVIGSSNGALTNLCAALGAPWLPQTVFVPLRQTDVHPDEPRDGLERAKETGRRFLEKNPDIQLHHMHDPNQDRLMLALMTYFRIKRRRLGPPYEAFLDRSLRPGDPILVVDCGESWPVTKVGERHYFQFGAVGGIPPEEFFEGSRRVEKYLAYYESHRRSWDAPAANVRVPEAEWGFEPTLLRDIERYAAERELRVVRLRFEETMDLSPFVAELYRWWYARRGRPTAKMLVQSFLLVEPYMALRAGMIPYWLTFGTDPIADAFEKYLDTHGPFDEIHMALFSHGTEGAGLAGIDRWRELLGRAQELGEFKGVNEDLYPRDFATLTRFQESLRSLPGRFPLDQRITLTEIAQFVRERGHEFSVEWVGLEEFVEDREPTEAHGGERALTTEESRVVGA